MRVWCTPYATQALLGGQRSNSLDGDCDGDDDGDGDGDGEW